MLIISLFCSPRYLPLRALNWRPLLRAVVWTGFQKNAWVSGWGRWGQLSTTLWYCFKRWQKRCLGNFWIENTSRKLEFVLGRSKHLARALLVLQRTGEMAALGHRPVFWGQPLYPGIPILSLHPLPIQLNWKINPSPRKVLADKGLSYCPFKGNLHFNRGSSSPKGINISNAEISSTSNWDVFRTPFGISNPTVAPGGVGVGLPKSCQEALEEGPLPFFFFFLSTLLPNFRSSLHTPKTLGLFQHESV